MTERKVSKLKLIEDVDTRPVRAADVWPEAYMNVFIAGPTGCGKTWLINDLIDMSLGLNTKLIIFSSTQDSDVGMRSIIHNYRKAGVDVITYSCIIDPMTKQNYLQDWILWKEAEDKEANGPSSGENGEEGSGRLIIGDENDYVDAEGDIQYVDPFKPINYIMVFDDMSDQLKKPVVGAMLKKCRHYKLRLIISSQDILDIAPTSWIQIKLVILFGKIVEDRLKDAFKRMRIMDMTFPQFLEYYHAATKEKGDFLYYDFKNMRASFGKKLN